MFVYRLWKYLSLTIILGIEILAVLYFYFGIKIYKEARELTIIGTSFLLEGLLCICIMIIGVIFWNLLFGQKEEKE